MIYTEAMQEIKTHARQELLTAILRVLRYPDAFTLEQMHAIEQLFALLTEEDSENESQLGQCSNRVPL